MVKSMKPGSVLIDLAVERGGNVEGARPGEVVDTDGVKIVGYTNVAGRVAQSASSLYARNLFSSSRPWSTRPTRRSRSTGTTNW